MKKLSIVILNYNSLKLVRDCLESFARHSPKVDYEIIVVNNDGNTKEFGKFSHHYPELKFIQNSGNWGFSSGCNLGARIATGEYLLFLNPDTQLNDTPAIDTMVDILEQDPNIGVCGCRTVTKRGIGNELSWSNPWLLIRWVRVIHDVINKSKIDKMFSEDKDIWFPGFVGGSALMLNVDDFRKIGGWSDDKYWMYCEDSDICFKVENSLGKKIALVRNCSIDHVGGGASKIDSDTTLMLKLEMIISTHNYIYHNSGALSRIIILPQYILKSTVPAFTKLFLSVVFYNREKIKKYQYLSVGIVKYYLKSIKRRTWKSSKLDIQ